MYKRPAFRLNLPYIIVGTAPSMDGYASSVSPMIYDGYKITYEAVAPMAIIGDTDVLCAAPEQMIAAGFGDMLGKLTARLDWVLAREVIGEHYCPTVAAMMARAVDKCLAQAEGLSRREPEAIVGLMEGLILSGIAMQMLGYSRPASGAEHHIAHYFEMKAMREGSEMCIRDSAICYRAHFPGSTVWQIRYALARRVSYGRGAATTACTGTRRAGRIMFPSVVRTWAVTCSGTGRIKAGTAPATVRALILMENC